jgi:hypothetical protein
MRQKGQPVRDHSFPPRGTLLLAAMLAWSAPVLAQHGPSRADADVFAPVIAMPENYGVPLFVEIDVVPGDPENILIAGSEDGVPVAVLSSPDFDAALVDPASLSLGGLPPMRGASDRVISQVFDVDGDGRADRLVHFRSHALRIEDNGSVLLTGRLASGTEFSASAPVRIVEPGGIEAFEPARAIRSRESGALALQVFPNPARGPFQVALALAGEGSATVELLDLAGRRIERRTAVAQRGRASVTFTRQVEPGRYVLRVIQGSRVAGRMVTILR